MNSSISKKVIFFFSQFQLHTFKKGLLLIQPDDQINQSYYLKEGYVRQYSVSPQGKEVTIHTFISNSFFPMTAIVAEIKNRYYFETLTEVKIYIAPKEKTLTFLKENPDVLLDLTSRILQGLDKITLRMKYLVTSKASQKVASVLLYLLKHFDQHKEKKGTIAYKFTHKDIASLAGLSRETTSREWKKLEKKGIVGYLDQNIVINDEVKLKRELVI